MYILNFTSGYDQNVHSYLCRPLTGSDLTTAKTLSFVFEVDLRPYNIIAETGSRPSISENAALLLHYLACTGIYHVSTCDQKDRFKVKLGNKVKLVNMSGKT